MKQKVLISDYRKSFAKKIQAQWRNWISSSLFNSVTKTVINHRIRLENSFQEILYMIGIWINNGSGWNVESIEYQYINNSTYRPLSGSSYIDLPIELRSPRKGLINIKNKDKKYFYGAMLEILILQMNLQK